MFFPKAEKIPYVHSLHGDERVDLYFWMRDRQNPAVIAYLEAENAYTEATMQQTQPLQTTLYKEMLSRIQETDLSVPCRDGDYYYYSRTEAGQAYAIHCRKKGSLEGAEEILLDENLLAAGYEFFELGTFEVSPDHQLLAYSVDTSGAELYTLFFLDLNTRELYPETIPETYYSFAWGNDCRTVFYTQVDAAHRPFKLFRHQLNTAIAGDTLVYHEPDDSYYLNIGKTRSEAYLIMSLSSKITSEVHYLEADNPTGEFQVIRPRTVGVEYDIEHHNDVFYI
ncbi:MAG: oligopeptidase B, partial [Cyanobacteria bacterium CAN_BIN43]|nr:oligopeptidase B [Cyanobacteria bacterium CAN_BIN43]